MRTELLFGSEGMEKLKNAKVALFGVGGVGGYVAEALARSGVGNMVLTDNDCVSVSNINRQIIATRSSVGKYKVDVMKERILDINPKAEVETYKCFYLPENADAFDFTKYSYVVDAVDTVTAKIEITMTMILHHMIMLSTVLIQLLPRLIWCLKRRKQEHRL